MATKKKWFKKVRGSYLPIAREGWLSYIPYIVFVIAIYAYAMIYFGYSVASLLIILFGWIFAGVVMTWFASTHSK